MRFLESPRDRAGLLILVLGVAILIALIPFLSGLLGAAILYVIFVGPYQPDGAGDARRTGVGAHADHRDHRDRAAAHLAGWRAH